MPQTFTVKLPNGQPINVEADTADQAAKAARQYLAYQDMRGNDKKIGQDKNDFGGQVARSMTFGLSDPVNAAVRAVASQAPRLAGQDPGYGLGDAFSAGRRVEADRAAEYNRDKPIRSGLAAVGGSMAAPGGQQMGKFIVGKGTGLLGQNLAAQSVRSGVVGGLLGASEGAATAEPGKELETAERGAKVGGAIGLVAPGAGAGLGKALGGTAKTVARAANKATGGKLLNPNTEALSQLATALRKDGLDETGVRQAMNDWMRVGGPSPALLDVAGENTRALIRGAAMKGSGRQAAQQYGNQVAADLQDNAIARTRQLSPDKRSVGQAREDITQARSQTASDPQGDYATAYASPVMVDEASAQALSGAPGRAALTRARSAAEAQMRGEQVAEIDSLLSGDFSKPISAGTLDRVRIAMGERADTAARRGANDMRAGLSQRTGMIDESLEGVPQMAPARAAYRDASQQLEGLDLGSGAVNAVPDEYTASLAASPGAQQTAPLGYARAIEEGIGRPTEGSTGFLNRLSTATNQGRNLATTYGDEAAGDYRQSIGQMVDQVNNARFINPNSGSQTAGRIADEGLVEMKPIPTTVQGVLIGLVNKLKAGATLTDAEREALVRFGTSSQAPSLPPRSPSQFSGQAALPAIGLEREYISGSR